MPSQKAAIPGWAPFNSILGGGSEYSLISRSTTARVCGISDVLPVM